MLRCHIFPSGSWFNAIPIKILANYFVNVDKSILKFIWKVKIPRLTNTILKKNKVGEMTLPNFKTYHPVLQWRQYGIGEIIDTWISEIEKRVQKHIQTHTIICSLAKEQRHLSAQSIGFSTNDAERIGHPCAKQC